jgi:hypothetical protein
MYIINFAPYTPGDRSLQSKAWVFVYNGITFREVEQMTGRVLPIVPLGSDPERAEAAKELWNALKASRVESGGGTGGWMLDPNGYEMYLQDATHRLVEEVLAAYRQRFAGLDDVETVEEITSFWRPILPEGPTKKMTSEEFAKYSSEKKG